MKGQKWAAAVLAVSLTMGMSGTAFAADASEYTVRNVRVDWKNACEADCAGQHETVLYFPLRVSNQTQWDYVRSGNQDKIEGFDSLKLSIYFWEGKDYVRDYSLEQEKGACYNIGDGTYVIQVRLGDNFTAQRQTVKGEITLQTGNRVLVDAEEFAYSLGAKELEFSRGSQEAIRAVPGCSLADGQAVLQLNQLSGNKACRQDYSAEAGAKIPLQGLPNTRDLGGYTTMDGRRLKYRRLLRSGDLAAALPADWNVLTQDYGLKKAGILALPSNSQSLVGRDISDPVKSLIHSYRAMGNSPQAVKEYRSQVYSQIAMGSQGDHLGQQQLKQYFKILLSQREGAVLWHGFQGEETAEIASAFLLTALGVPRDTVVADFVKTNQCLSDDIRNIENMAKNYCVDTNLPATEEDLSQVRQKTQKEKDTWILSPGARELTQEELYGIRLLAGVDESYILAALDGIEAEYGSMETYFQQVLGLTSADLERLEALYLEDAVGKTGRGCPVVNFTRDVKSIQLEGDKGFRFSVQAENLGKINLSFDNEVDQQVLAQLPRGIDCTFYNFYGKPQFEYAGRVTITPPQTGKAYYLYEILENGKLRRVSTELGGDGMSLEFGTQTLSRYVLCDIAPL